MIEIKNNTISVTKTRKLTPKQLMLIKQMGTETQQKYLMSLIGHKHRQSINRLKGLGYDELSNKAKLSTMKRLNELTQVTADHKPFPIQLGQWVGVEIECYIPHQDSDGDCNCSYDGDDIDYHEEECSIHSPYWSESDAHDWLSTRLRHAGVKRCTVKEDGSLSDDEGHGVEVTILLNTAYGYEPLEKLCYALNKAKVYVNDTCGLHVHLDMRHLKYDHDVNRIGKSLGHALPVLKWMVDDTRHNNTYCKMQVGPLVDGQSSGSNPRYYAVNMSAYYRFKTIEVRLHGGSTNFSKIKNWIELLKIVSTANLKSNIDTFQEFIDVLRLPDYLVEYAESRIEKLNPNAWPMLMVLNVIAPRRSNFDEMMDTLLDINEREMIA